VDYPLPKEGLNLCQPDGKFLVGILVSNLHYLCNRKHIFQFLMHLSDKGQRICGTQHKWQNLQEQFFRPAQNNDTH
jgi:hypothetical protein